MRKMHIRLYCANSIVNTNTIMWWATFENPRGIIHIMGPVRYTSRMAIEDAYYALQKKWKANASQPPGIS